MNWIKDSAWQLGIGVLLAGVGGLWMYRSALEGNITGTWTGLVIFFAAMALPLIRRFFHAGGEEE